MKLWVSLVLRVKFFYYQHVALWRFYGNPLHWGMIARLQWRYWRVVFHWWPIKPYAEIMPYNEPIDEYEAFAYEWQKQMAALNATYLAFSAAVADAIQPALDWANRLNTGICTEEEIWK